MKPTPRRTTRLRMAAWGGAISSAALLLWTAVAATPPEDASLLCPSGVGGSLVANSARLTTDSKLFQANYSTIDWTGGLRAVGVNADGSLGNASDWDANGPGKIPAADQRRIFTASSRTTGINFTWSALGAAGLQYRIGSEAMLNYLRGDQANEQSPTNPDGFRARSRRLGAIVNSEIAFAGLDDFGYEALVDPANPTSSASVAGLAYPAYLQTKQSRTKLLIVGANDGMLHGFDADTGTEKFAFVPRALLNERISEDDPRSTLVRLADTNFSRRYYVDGSAWVGDAYLSGAWRTVAVGNAGAGSKGVFALDITDPEGMAAGKLLWDLSGQSDSNLGFAFGEPVIGRLTDGDFYAIFGNGRDSANQCAVLYLVRLRDGWVRRISTGGTCVANGLGRPSLYDVHVPGSVGYRTTDFVYAGDLNGNLWRFDLRSLVAGDDDDDDDDEDSINASVQLVFTARNGDNQVQPITGAIEVGAAPSGVTGNPPPAMLWFGTGRYLTESDPANVNVQSMYGIVDRFTGGEGAQVARSSLQAQTVNVSGDTAGTITGTDVNYTGGTPRQDGWFLDLPRSGERMIGQPLIQSGRLLFSTLTPDNATCIGSGASSIFVVDPYYGRALLQRVFVNHPGVDFITSSVGIVRGLVGVDAGVKAYLYAGGTTPAGVGGSTIQFEEIRPAQQAGPRGRVSWREIVK